MSAEDRQRISARWGMQIAAVMAVMALAAELFRINDPWMLLPLGLCVTVSVLWLHFRFSAVDAAVLAVCLYDVATWILNPITGMYAARISLTGLCAYLLLREASCRAESISLFLKLSAGIAGIPWRLRWLHSQSGRERYMERDLPMCIRSVSCSVLSVTSQMHGQVYGYPYWGCLRWGYTG